MPPLLSSIALLTIANVFMTFAWYGHLAQKDARPLWMAVLVSWGIAFFEYCFQVPGNRIGSQVISLGQLKVTQEVITMLVFMGFSVTYLKKPVSFDFVCATACLGLAAFFVFRRP